MTTREKTKLKAKVRKILKVWIALLQLQDWELDIHFQDTPVQDGQDEWIIYAHCEPSWEYSSATITFYLEPLSTLEDKELERWVVHELGHILVSELREIDKDLKHEERVVRNITKAFLTLRYQP